MFEQPEIVVGEVVATQAAVARVVDEARRDLEEFEAWRSEVAEKARLVLEPERDLTVNQRAKRIADCWYAMRRGMANHIATQQIVKKAVNCGMFDDRQILEGLWEVRKASRPLTVESLMWVLERENRERMSAMESKSRHQVESEGRLSRAMQRAIQKEREMGIR